MSSPTLTTPQFEHHHNGLGINTATPRISWRFVSSETTAKDWSQTGYDIEVTPSRSGVTAVYHVDGDLSVLVPWPASALESCASAKVRVRSFGGASAGEGKSQPTEWSSAATVETAFLDPSRWKASFITAKNRIGPAEPLQPLWLCKDFTLDLDQTASSPRARLYVTALGAFEAYINGQRVGDECMAPGWTSYNHRLTYRILDVTSLLDRKGKNTMRILLGEGWYAARLGFKQGKRFHYGGNEIALLAQLEVQTGENEEPWRLVSDDSWKCSSGPIQQSELYDGEIYDQSKEVDIHGIAVTASLFAPTKILPWPRTTLVSPDAPPVRPLEQIRPKEIFKSKSGKTIIDFGQNLVGKLLVPSLSAPEDTQVVFKHAEVMEHGELGTRPLRYAKATDSIITSGKELTDWTPTFTFHGFRYVQVEGWTPTMDNIVAQVLHSDMRRCGHFNCSNASVNQLHSNVLWSMKGNFLSIPTDCPQRDERLGWTGDIQVFAPSANFLYDTTSFLSSWLEDLSAEQMEEGKGSIPPLVCPNVLPPNWPHIPQAVWDDVVVLTPFEVYRATRDVTVLERQFPGMQAWLDEGVDRDVDGLWNPDRWQLADWLDPSAPPDDPGYARTDSVLVANAYLVHVTHTMAQICTILSKAELATKYSADASRLKALFQHKYITAAGNLMSSTQTGLALAIQFALYPADAQMQRTAATQLRKLVRAAKFHISTGFAGTNLIASALTTIGQPQLAYRMLLEQTCPSWLYPVTMGATTIWERWDSMLPDGTINPGQMTSFNHYALGAIAEWLHGTLGGISPAESGWKVVRVRPVPGGNVTRATVKFDGPYGLVECDWKLTGGDGRRFEMRLVVPPNSTALVTLPSELKRSVDGEDGTRTVSSGVHHFECDWIADEWPPQAIWASNQTPQETEVAV